MARRVLCNCSLCVNVEYPRGQYIPKTTRWMHLKQDAQRNIGSSDAGAVAQGSSQQMAEVATAIQDTATQEATFMASQDDDVVADASVPVSALALLEAEVSIRLQSLDLDEPLVFTDEPSLERHFVCPDPEEILHVNSGQFSLNTTRASNRWFLDNEVRFCGLLLQLQQSKHTDANTEKMQDCVYAALIKMHERKAREWRIQAATTDEHHVDNRRYFGAWNPINPVLTTVFMAAMIIFLRFQTPIRHMRVILALFRCLLKIKGADEDATNVPKHVETILSHYDLDPKYRTYVCCPECYALYPFTQEDLQRNRQSFESSGSFDRCVWKTTPDVAPCGAILWRKRRIGSRTFVVPRRKQLHQDLKEWIGRLLVVPGVEDALEAHRTRQRRSDRQEDFSDSKLFHSCKGHDNVPFMSLPPGSTELRLLASLGFDAFNPFHSRTAHQVVSSTGVYMVLLVLPEHLRYLPQFVYLVTVIPGPGKPSLEQVNHTLNLVVDSLLPFWRGVEYSRTHKYPTGRRVALLAIPVVCDVEGAHQVAGFPSHASTYFCTRCLLPLQEIHNLNPDTWPRRDFWSHVQAAEEWRDAQTSEERQRIVSTHGVRWSALLRLPYWNPISFTVIDDMHLAYLGLFDTHIRDVWQIDMDKDGGEGLLSSSTKYQRPPNVRMRVVWSIIRQNGPELDDWLKQQNKDILWYICFTLKLRTTGTKSVHVDEITKWRASVDPDSVPNIPPLDYGAHASASELQWSFVHPDGNRSVYSVETVSSTSGSDMISQHSSSADIELPSADSVPHYTQPPSFEQLQYRYFRDRFKDPSIKHVSTNQRLDFLLTLCEELRIFFNLTDSRDILRRRLDLWRAELSGSQPTRNVLENAAYQETKNTFETKDRSHAWLKRQKLPILRALCQEYEIPHPTNSTKDQLAEKLKLWRKEFFSSTIEQEAGALPRQVLGKDVMMEIRQDMEKSVLPHWISRAPYDWGTPTRGKLSADEWKVVCSIHLVITLIRLWGYEEPTHSRKHQMLTHYIHLVKAVHILFLRGTSSSLIAEYDHHIREYVGKLIELYPDVSIKPNHHYSYHMSEFLRSMGPGHSRSTPVFERINGSLQDINTNRHVGELESTMLMSYCRRANLQLFLDHDPSVTRAIGEALEVMKDIDSEDHRGIFTETQSEVAHTKFKSRPSQISSVLLIEVKSYLARKYQCSESYWNGRLSCHVTEVDGIAIGRVIYSPVHRQHDNSHVIAERCNATYAGQIQKVFTLQYVHPVTNLSIVETFLVVRRFKPTAHIRDCYKEFGMGWLCERDIATEEHILPVGYVLSHFVRTDLTVENMEVMHVYPVPKVFYASEGRPGL